MAEPLLTHRGVVYPSQCDHMGHMNVRWYVGKFDEATWNLLATVGLTSTAMRTQNTGMVAVEQTISYKRELVAGDTLTIHSIILEVKDKVIRFTHEMRNNETAETAATMTLVGVHLDTRSRKACPLPEEVRRRAAAMIEGKQ